MRTPLCEIAAKWGTDKTGWHEYTPIYHRLLAGREVKKVVEIGIGSAEYMAIRGYITGASLYMWRDYFPGAWVCGLDIDRKALLSMDTIPCYYCDQSNEASLRAALGKIGSDIDLIVDDGSHVAEHQILSMKILAPALSPSGIYVIEDVHVPPERITAEVPEGFRAEVIEAPSQLICECGCGGPEKLVVIRRD